MFGFAAGTFKRAQSAVRNTGSSPEFNPILLRYSVSPLCSDYWPVEMRRVRNTLTSLVSIISKSRSNVKT